MSLSILLYTSKTLADGSHPVMLQIIQKKQVKRASLGLSCYARDWDAKERKFLKSYPNYQEANKTLRRKFQEAEELWDDLSQEGHVDLTRFFSILKGEETPSLSVLDLFDQIIKELKAKKKIGNMNKYKQVRNRVKQYKGNVSFEGIDYKYLQGFEVFLFENGSKEGGVNFNMRTLRAVYNRAILQGIVDQKHYPFYSQLNRKGYSLGHLKSSYKPRPLSIEEIEQIKNFPVDDHPHLKDSVLFFLFSYYCNGMSFVDMCFLKRENIQSGRIHYTRRKTKKPMPSIKITDMVQTILNYFSGNDYLFPVLKSHVHVTEQQKYDRYRKVYKKYSEDLKVVAHLLGFTINLTSYTSRHSFGNVLKRKGVDVGRISELYGHSDVEVTKHYLQSFGDDQLDDANELL